MYLHTRHVVYPKLRGSNAYSVGMRLKGIPHTAKKNEQHISLMQIDGQEEF